jgi:RES domain-containing protein
MPDPFEPDPRITEALVRLQPSTLDREVWKHTFAGQAPAAPNNRGARWNPPTVPAIYVSLDRDTCLAEGAHRLAMQPIAPQRGQQVHRISVHLERTLDLTGPGVLAGLGVREADLTGSDFLPCQLVGGTAEWLGHDAITVPSVRGMGSNLVIFERATDPNSYRFEVVETEDLPA